MLHTNGHFSLKNLENITISNGNFCSSPKGICVVENVYLNKIQMAPVPFWEGKTHVTF